MPQHRRRRLIIVGTRSKHPLQLHLQLELRAHVSAASFVRFDQGTWSPMAPPRRAPSTLARAAAGQARHGHRSLMPYYASGSGLTGRCLSRPIGTITTLDRWAIVEEDRMRMLTADENRSAMGSQPSTSHRPSTAKLCTCSATPVCPPVARDVISVLKQGM